MQLISKTSSMLFLLLAIGAVSAQTLKEEVPLLDKPDGAKIAAGKAGTLIKIKRRQGFWVEVDLGGKTGWVPLTKLNMGGSSGGSVSIDTGRSGTGNIVSASSARGLSAKDLLNGKPDRQAVARMDAFEIDAAAVGRFRSEGGVAPLAEKVALIAPASKPAKATSAPPKADDDFDRPKKAKRAGDDW